MSYCEALKNLKGERLALHKNYHDNFYGFPIHNDNDLFCRLVMEMNQAGLSWETILKKKTSENLTANLRSKKSQNSKQKIVNA